jgi:transcriptional regulator with XRE-family HTH domain
MKLKDYRTAKGMTLSDFGKLIGVAEATVSRYEAGRLPEKRILERICEVTCGDVGLHDFYNVRNGDSA